MVILIYKNGELWYTTDSPTEATEEIWQMLFHEEEFTVKYQKEE